jgi:hypothetical protein
MSHGAAQWNGRRRGPASIATIELGSDQVLHPLERGQERRPEPVHHDDPVDAPIHLDPGRESECTRVRDPDRASGGIEALAPEPQPIARLPDAIGCSHDRQPVLLVFEDLVHRREAQDLLPFVVAAAQQHLEEDSVVVKVGARAPRDARVVGDTEALVVRHGEAKRVGDARCE